MPQREFRTSGPAALSDLECHVRTQFLCFLLFCWSERRCSRRERFRSQKLRQPNERMSTMPVCVSRSRAVKLRARPQKILILRHWRENKRTLVESCELLEQHAPKL